MTPPCWLFSHNSNVVFYSIFVYQSFTSIALRLNEFEVLWIIKLYNSISVLSRLYQLFTFHQIIVCIFISFLLLVSVCFHSELARGMIAVCSPMPFSIHSSLGLYYQILIGFSSYYTEIRGLSVDFHFPLCCDNTSHHTHLVPATFL